MEKSIVSIELPRNCSNEDRLLFEAFTQYDLPELRLLKLREVFVAYSGLCMDATGVIPECYHPNGDKEAIYKDVAYYYEKAQRIPESLIELDDDNNYVLVHHPWSTNYWHWITEAIPRILMIGQKSGSMVLLLPEHYDKIEFVRASLAPFAFRDIFIIPQGKSLLVRNLWLPQIKEDVDSYYSDIVSGTRAVYLQAFNFDFSRTSPVFDRIYISRKKASRRRVVNEDEVERLLLSFGFVIVCNEDYSFRQQIELYASARYVVSVHGAGLTNMIFMREGSSVLELHKRMTNGKDWHSLAFWRLSNTLNYTYYHQICEPANPLSSFFDADLVIDIEKLKQNIKLMIP
ncbi:MAG: glycosyltransferase family 61 protein [Chryseolinea sp.]